MYEYVYKVCVLLHINRVAALEFILYLSVLFPKDVGWHFFIIGRQKTDGSPSGKIQPEHINNEDGNCVLPMTCILYFVIRWPYSPATPRSYLVSPPTFPASLKSMLVYSVPFWRVS